MKLLPNHQRYRIFKKIELLILKLFNIHSSEKDTIELFDNQQNTLKYHFKLYI